MLREKDINSQIKDLIANGKLQAAEHAANYTRDADWLWLFIRAALDNEKYDKAYELAAKFNVVEQVAEKYEIVKRIEKVLEEEFADAYKISKNFNVVEQVAEKCEIAKRIEKILEEGNFELAYDTASNFNVIEEESVINGFTTLIAGMSASSVLSVRATGKYKKLNTIFNERLLEEGIGEIIEFGTYQNETIRWRVIDKSGDKKLLISERAIDCKSYHSINDYITWEKCDLRKWLNEEFIKEAFSEEEQKHINKTRISNKDNERYKTKGGNDTEDKLFLLSIEEAYKYFADDNDRICKATDYAKKRGAWTSSSGSCWWWLRSPGSISLNAAGVSHGGDVCESGCYVRGDDRAVRPAFWLNP